MIDNMYPIDKSLLDGRLICLTPIDVEKDAEIESMWTHDPEYLRLLGVDVVLPLSPAHLKKRYEDLEKKMAESGDQFYFAIRLQDGDAAESENTENGGSVRRLVGFIELDGVHWSHGDSYVGIGIGERECWSKGYGTDAMKVVLRYAFEELNLHRVSLNVFEYNQRAIHSYEKVGFVVEGCERQFLRREGKRWDMIYMGILRADWEEKN